MVAATMNSSACRDALVSVLVWLVRTRTNNETNKANYKCNKMTVCYNYIENACQKIMCIALWCSFQSPLLLLLGLVARSDGADRRNSNIGFSFDIVIRSYIWRLMFCKIHLT